MKLFNQRKPAFTLLEVMVSTAMLSVVGTALSVFSFASARLIARNLATNHTHEAAMLSEQRLLGELHAAGSPFGLVDYNGTTYSDVTAAITTDVDPLSHQFLSTRANAIRFWRVAGGPYRLTASTLPATTTLSFDFAGMAYAPMANDKIYIPLIQREFQITAVTTVPTSLSTTGTFTINAPVGSTLTANGVNVMTAYFFRQSGYSVYNGTLRYHPNFDSVNRNTSIVIQRSITSPKPFSLLYRAGTISNADARISLELYESAYTGSRFLNGTTTLQSVISGRNRPAYVDLNPAL